MSKNGFGWLGKKREENQEVIQPNREAAAPAPVETPAVAETRPQPAFQREPGARDRIGFVEITKRQHEEGAPYAVCLASFMPESSNDGAVRRTLRLNPDLDARLKEVGAGNENGLIQGLLVYALEQLRKSDKAIAVEFVNEDGTPRKRKRKTKAEMGQAAAGSSAAPSSTDPNQDGGEE